MVKRAGDLVTKATGKRVLSRQTPHLKARRSVQRKNGTDAYSTKDA
jgi:hypothetical protein